MNQAKGKARLRFTLDDIADAPVETDAPPLPLGAVIKVVGVGGGGNNAINRMIAGGVTGVDFIAVNTDQQALEKSRARTKVQIGAKLTRGLGTGGDPSVGREAALEDTERLLEKLQGADMVFVTTGLGGGTGTGASPVVASLASQIGALVVAVVTKPFDFEGKRRRNQAEEGLLDLKRSVDTVITIPNQKLLATIDEDTPIDEAFALADDVLRQAVEGISELILTTGEVNRDFADVRAVMKGMGMALMGAGVAEGEHRAVEAAQQAISSPLLEDASIQGAKGVIFNVTGGDDLKLREVSEAASIIHDAADPDATIMFGYVRRKEMTGKVKVTVIATGFRAEEKARRQEPVDPWLAERALWAEERERLVGSPAPIPVVESRGSVPVIPPTGRSSSPYDDPELFDRDPNMANLNRDALNRNDLEIPAFLRRIQD